MKKTLTNLLFLLTGLNLSAQCISSYNSTGFYDDFTSVTDKDSLYFWDEATLTGDANPNFQAVKVRSGGVINYTVSQGKGEYVPFGVSFGDNNGTPITIDLSGDKTFSVKFTNNSDSTIIIRMTIQDINGNELDTYSDAVTDGQFSNAWKYTIATGSLAPNASTTFSGTYAGAVKANYTNSTFVSTFDFTKVKGVYITVLNNNKDAADGYKPLKLSSVDIAMDAIKVGACVSAGSNSVVEEQHLSFSLFPNPVSEGELNVSVNADQASSSLLRVFDMQGRLLKEQNCTVMNGAFTLDVSMLESGLYSLSLISNTESHNNLLFSIK